ncbi:T6SS effector BTH_I2691 family protein, partial [Chimaeribacter arupi]|uniref:T6SS effector BTH_I2691 family protein n=1 Tax=Chimaeribacter arupi TaxID=2060066 RepID=UPI002948215A
MSTQKGCKFCTRYGLPLLPIRPAVKEEADTLPVLPGHITVPAAAQGGTAWTGRLLRQGFLSVWYESGRRWINYFVTREGYYYPLPAEGDISPAIVEGKIRPCITQPDELACASLITLPVKPAGMKNGLFWFGWSEVEWTEAVRRRHEDADYRSQYMQRFDMDAWLSSGQGEQVIALSALSETVAEYSPGAGRSTLPAWSPAPWKALTAQAGIHLRQAAETLCPGKGAMMVLQDPVAVAQDIAWLANDRINKHFYENPLYTRELALTAAVGELKRSLCAQFEREIVLNDQIAELNAGHGYYTPHGMFVPGAEAAGAALRRRHTRLLAQRVEAQWQEEYGKYYDDAQEKRFTDAFNAALREYDKAVIVPMMTLYLACVEGPELVKYFRHNFDTKDPDSGILYTQSVTDCIDGLQDKLLVSHYFQLKLAGSCTDEDNVLARAAVFNNDRFAAEINTATRVSLDITAVPFDRGADGFKDIFDQRLAGAQLALEKFQNALNGAVYSLLEHAVNARPVDALVSFAVVANKRVKLVTLTAERKHFVTAVVEELAGIFDVSRRATSDQLRHYVDIEVRHIEATDMDITGTQRMTFALLVDLDAVEEVKVTGGGTAAMAKTLRSAEEVKATLFPRTLRSKLVALKATAPASLSQSALKSLPFSGAVLSGAFQIFALTHAGLPKEFTVEATSRFAANIAMAAGAVADSIERLLRDFKGIRWNAQIRLALGAKAQRMMMRGLRFVKWLGGAAGVIGVVFDIYNAKLEWSKGKKDIAVAYACSALGGGILTYAVLFNIILSPVWITIAVVLMIGAALYLSLNIKNDIQLWLMRCLWRKIPADEK